MSLLHCVLFHLQLVNVIQMAQWTVDSVIQLLASVCVNRMWKGCAVTGASLASTGLAGMTPVAVSVCIHPAQLLLTTNIKSLQQLTVTLHLVFSTSCGPQDPTGG